MLDGQPAAAAIAPDGANAAQHGGRSAHRGAAGLQAPAPNAVPPPEGTAYRVDLHRQVFNAKLQEYMASKAKNMTLLFESEYAQALECLRIYDTLEVGSEERKAAPTARKFELLTRGGGSGPCASLTPEEEAIWLAVAAAEAENEHLDQQADERRDTLQAAAAPAELGAAGANEWGPNAKTEVARILVVVCSSSQGQAPSFRSGCGVLSDLVALSGEAYKAVVEVEIEWNPTLLDAMAQLHSTLLYFVCPAVDTGDGSSGGLSLGALRLAGGNVEAGGVASQEEIAECTCSGGSTCQGVNVDAKDGMRLAEVLRRRRRGVLGVETGGDPDVADTPEPQAVRSSVDRSKPDAQCLVCIVIEVNEHGLSGLRPRLES
eukprot:jgi/Tetstr1/434740/TSEL_023792.t1